MNEQGSKFEGYSYRTSCRFGNRVKVLVDDGTVTVTGPRLGVLPYRLWIAVQLVLFWAIVPALLAALALWEGRYLTLALALLLVHWVFSGLGAVVLWAWVDVSAMANGSDPSVSFPVSAVKQVKIGRGWDRNGLWLVIPPYIPALNAIAEGRTVSFEAPDGEKDGEAVYAIFMRSEADAQALAGLLQGEWLQTSEVGRKPRRS